MAGSPALTNKMPSSLLERVLCQKVGKTLVVGVHAFNITRCLSIDEAARKETYRLENHTTNTATLVIDGGNLHHVTASIEFEDEGRPSIHVPLHPMWEQAIKGMRKPFMERIDQKGREIKMIREEMDKALRELLN